MESDSPSRLARASHIRYALRHLRLLPPPYQSDDSNRITFGFFALGSLAILGALDRLDHQERADYVDWIYRRWNETIGGFGGAPNVDLRDLGPHQAHRDQPHLTHTYSALLILALLSLPTDQADGPQPESPFQALDLIKLLDFVRLCQRPNGSFGSFPNSPDEDVRFVYCAIAILAMVRVDPHTVINVESTVSFLKSCRRYEGGYGQAPYFEAQGGTTYCVLASLALLNRLEDAQTDEEAEETIRWLVDRQGELVDPLDAENEDTPATTHSSQSDAKDHLSYQKPIDRLETTSCPMSLDPCPPLPTARTVAGFQGRIGKPLDACYSFWCTAGLTIMAKRRHRRHSINYVPLNVFPEDSSPSGVQEPSPVLYDPKANIEFILLCQSKQWGGIARSPDDHPDVYHTYLSLASLCLSRSACTKEEGWRDEGRGMEGLPEYDALLNVPMRASQWIKQCFSAPQKT